MATQTPNIGLNKTADGEYGWGQQGRDNADTLDVAIGAEHRADGSHKVINADTIVLNGQSRSAWDATAGNPAIGSLDQVLAQGSVAANILAGQQVQIQNAAGTQDLLVVDEQRGLMGMIGNIQSPLTSLPMKRMKESDSVVDINITTAAALNTNIAGMDYFQSNTIDALPSNISLVGSIVRNAAGEEFTCYAQASLTVISLAAPKGSGYVVTAGAHTASVRRLQGDFSGKETFNRHSTGTYIDSLTGLVKTAMPNEMRFERMADGGVGALLEGSSTNIAVNSDLGLSGTANTSIPTPFSTFVGSVKTVGSTVAGRHAATKAVTLVVGKQYTFSVAYKPI
ncbi:MAG: hypothetical protein R8M45_00180, partial [Ghiorsea sp.]